MLIPLRPSALTIPEVTVCPSPKGLPMAMTKSPTSRASLSPTGSAVRPSASIPSNAMSVPGSLPRISASKRRLSLRVTVTESALATTW